MMKNRLGNWLLFVLLCIIWGSSFKLIRDSRMALSASQIAALRIFSAGAVFVPFAFFHFRKIPRQLLGLVILSAVFGNLGPAFLFALALTKIDGSLTGILNSITPIFVVITGYVFFGKRIQSQKILGVIVGFIGLVLLTVAPVLTGEKNIGFQNLSYSLLIVLATFLYGINVNMVSQYLKGIYPIHAATVSLAFMTVPAGIILFVTGFFKLNFHNPSTQTAVISTLILGVFGSAFATALFYILVKRAGALFASLVTYGIPFVALAWGFIDNEQITWIKICCLPIILLGVYFANLPEKNKVETSQQ